jgi:hypothetical protein
MAELNNRADMIARLAEMLEDAYCARRKWRPSEYAATIKAAKELIGVVRPLDESNGM